MKLDPNIAVSEGGVLFHPGTGDSYACNATGTEILKRLRAGEARKEILAQLEAQYGQAADGMDKDLEDFLEQLRNARLVDSHD